MVDVKSVVVSVIAVLSMFLKPGIRAQPTIGSSSEDDSCSQLEEELELQEMEIMRLRGVQESEWQKVKTLENVSNSQAEEIKRLKLQLKIERRRPAFTTSTIGDSTVGIIKRSFTPVTATFIGSFDHSESRKGITKVEDKIYVVDRRPHRIKIYEDRIGFRFMTDIALNGTGINWPTDIVYSSESKCVYISDSNENCIWVMTTTGDHRLSKWLNNVTSANTLSLSNEGHLLVLRRGEPFSQIDIYSVNATLIRRLQLPLDIKYPIHVVQTSVGNFIISHHLQNATDGLFVISQLTNDGQLIHRFIPRNQSKEPIIPHHLSLDSDNNRLFVTDRDNDRVILFDSSDLTWGQVLVSNGIRWPVRLFYDASKKHLFVSQLHANAVVYKIN